MKKKSSKLIWKATSSSSAKRNLNVNCCKRKSPTSTSNSQRPALNKKWKRVATWAKSSKRTKICKNQKCSWWTSRRNWNSWPVWRRNSCVSATICWKKWKIMKLKLLNWKRPPMDRKDWFWMCMDTTRIREPCWMIREVVAIRLLNKLGRNRKGMSASPSKWLDRLSCLLVKRLLNCITKKTTHCLKLARQCKWTPCLLRKIVTISMTTWFPRQFTPWSKNLETKLDKQVPATI